MRVKTSLSVTVVFMKILMTTQTGAAAKSQSDDDVALAAGAEQPFVCDPQGEVCAPPRGSPCPSAYPIATGVTSSGCCAFWSGPCQTCCTTPPSPVPPGPSGICDEIKRDLPSECSLASCNFQTDDGVVIDCHVSLFGNDVEVSVKLDICDAKGASLEMDLGAFGHTVSHTFHLDQPIVDIPVLPIPIPSIPWAADAEIDLGAGLELSGSLLDVSVTLDVCARILGYGICAGSLGVPFLPLDILDFPFNLNTACGHMPPEPPAPPPGPPPPDPIPAPPAPPGMTHYGDPDGGKCDAPDERAITVTGIAGKICAPTCSATVGCPIDKPLGTKALAACVLSPVNSARVDSDSDSDAPPGSGSDEHHSWTARAKTCQQCLATGTNSYCWKDDQCHTVGSIFNPCNAEQCVSASSFSGCECTSCSDKTCAVPPTECALICGPKGDLSCPEGATCKLIENTGVCTYDKRHT